MNRSLPRTAACAASILLAAVMLVSVLVGVSEARAASVPLGGGETRVAFSAGLDKALRQQGIAVKPLGPATLKGRKLTLPVASGSYDPEAEQAGVAHGGGFSFAAGGKVVALRKLALDTSTRSLSATVAGKRMRFASLGAPKLEREGFDARLKARRLGLTSAAAAALNRVFGSPQAFRAGRSLGSVDGVAEPSEFAIASGLISIGGPDTAFSRLGSLMVEMGIWGGTEAWGSGAEKSFLFPVQPTRIAADASTGIIEGAESAGVSMEVHAPLPRQMLLRHPRIDLASRELSATISPLSQEGALTGTIATLDYSAARIRIRSTVGAIELTGIRAVSNQFMADQLNTRFATPGLFQAGETLVDITITLHA